MPRLDGRLYEWEKTAAKKEKQASKPQGLAKAAKKDKPAPAAEPDRVIDRQEYKSLDEVAAKVEERLAPRKGGRPVGSGMKATPEMIEAILESIRGGMPLERAAIIAGVSKAAMDKWKKANATVSHLFEQAEAQNEARLVGVIDKATKDDWKAANWLLERRHQWQQRLSAELTGKNGGPILSVSQQLLASVATGAAPVEKSKPRRPIIDVTPSAKE